ncbi:DUF1090 domain-containing protein [Salmonella enterica subsp. houtenae]|nr:DUF1090 domain-containing protein [Salmonella enterica]ECH8774018.1 DUF1090 domain-containing protein [Salmonella enterica subsp. houtenae]EDU8770357.1 DUF1090 domain-containing protein [Salmonella enterica subsp. houtenae]EDV9971545.1 DUF1090 domain-containing protein [Salmonella enterica subsp. houtenae]MDJ7173873.1 DUF1090 domain-containing protein [Salmonella enterica]
MRYIKTIFFLPATLLLSGQTYAAFSTDCTAKKQEIENQISYAREHSNNHQIAGLQKALRETEEHCTETQLLKQHQLKIAEKEKKVTERQAELERAIETGNPRQMTQKKKKLDRAHEELQDARNMLYQ